MATRYTKHNLLYSVFLFAVGLALSTTVGHAASFSFTSGSTTGSGYGNSVQRSSGGIDVSVTAWSLNTLSGTFNTGQIKIYSTGMGACNQSEGTNCGSPLHTVDNAGQFDFLAFSFSQSVLLGEGTLSAWASDFDATVWAGTGSLSLTDQTLAGSNLGTGIEDLYDEVGEGSASTGEIRSLGLSSLFSDPVDWFVISASLSNTSPLDRFKFKGLTVEAPPPGGEVPEPATAILFGTGLIGVLAARHFMKRRPTQE